MLEYSVALIAVAFTALVIYLIMTLKSARASLEQIDHTLNQVRGELKSISEESLKLIQNTTEITADVQGKIKQLNGLFESVGHVGESVNEVTSSMKQVSATVAQSVTTRVKQAADQQDDRMNQVVKWATMAMKLWFKWQDNKKASEAKSKQQYIKQGED